MTAKKDQKSFATSDETREFEPGMLDLLRIGGAEIGRLTLQPGWRWSEHVKPLAGTDLCQVRRTSNTTWSTGLHVDRKCGASHKSVPANCPDVLGPAPARLQRQPADLGAAC